MRVLLLISFLIFGATTSARADFSELYKEHSASVVTVFTVSLPSNPTPRSSLSRGIGSGVLIEDDQILTAAHVVDGAQVIEVKFTDGTRIRGDVISSLESSDIALVKLREKHPDPQVATLGDSDDTLVGSEVFIIGAPFGIAQTLTVGHLSGRLNKGLLAGGAPIEFLQTDTAINTGNSGGPMFNKEGEVIGIVSFILSKSGGFDGIGFATSSNTTREALLNSSGVLAGFEGILIDKSLSKALNYPRPGLLVQRVNENSTVANAGLKAGRIPAEIRGQTLLLGGDLILEINGLICEGPHNFSEIRESVRQLAAHESFAIKVFRAGKVVELIASASGDGILQTIKASRH